MKKVYLLISLMLSALAVGCNTNDPVDETPVGPGTSGKTVVTVNATLPSDLVWVAGDKVAINGLESNAVSEEGAGKASYAFSATDVEAPIVVVAPFEILTGLNEVTLPASQQFIADSFDRAAYAMAGIAPQAVPVSEEDEKNLVADVDLTPVVGVITLPLTLDSATAEAPVAIKNISVTALSGAALNGVWNAEAKTNTDEAGVVTYDVELTGVTNTATTVLNCDEGVEINSSAPTYFSLVVPAGVYTGGFEVVITDTQDHNFVLTLAEDIAVERGVNLELTPSLFTVIEKAPATLTVKIGEAGINWVEGDAVVCNNSLSTNTVDAAAAGTQTAQFNFEAVAYPYSVFYPAEYYTTSGSLRFHDSQPIVKNEINHGLMAMAGYSATNEVTLNNLCGIVSIPITNLYEGETIVLDKVEVRTSEGDPIAGKYHINYRTNALTSVAGKSAIVLNPNEGEFTIAPEETATVNFIVPKGSIRNGLYVNIYSSVGLLENHRLFPTGLTVRGGETAAADVYEYKEVKIEKIVTAEELIDFAKCVNMGRYKKFVNEEGKVVLGGDIDMASVSVEAWPMIAGPANEAGLPVGFDGIFDGCGFSIKNWATSQPLFHTVAATGKVMNVNIDASCALNMPQEGLAGLTGGAAIAFLVAHNLGEVSGCTNNADVLCNAPENPSVTRAALVGYSAIGANLRDCSNYGNVTIEIGTHGAGTGYIGTVSGRFASSAETLGCGVYNCKNYGALTINVSTSNTSNFYIGAVTGSSNSYTVTEGCENYGNATFNTNNSGAAVCFGGITSYSAGEIKNCINEGNITFKSTAQLKGTIVAGIAPYQNGPISGCTNKGEIYMEGGIFGGRNTVGSISTSASTSSAAPTAAGVVGYGYSSSGSPFSMDNCHNYGKVTYNWFETDGSGTSGRTQVAGVIGSPCGDVTNCNNYGDVTFIAKYKTAIVNHLSYIGGIAGSDYYAMSQSESSIINCVNEGNITIDCDCGTSNNAAGGIIGWPGKESACTNVTENCVNKGNIVVSGEGKFRLGGIQGGSGIIKGCTNEGSITINSSNSGSNYGGLAGFHSGGYELIDSTNTGDIVCNVPISGGGVAGMAGNLGNSAHDEGKMKNNTIKCLVKSVEGTCGVGIVVGHFNGNTKTIYFGTADEPIKVGGSLQIGDVTTVVDATNCNDPAVLANGCSNYLETAHIFNCVLAE
ncbi:MAG: hypothetical protein E7143_03210 [Rikenellaceae bacterium]|nr:hypothetical protein [Rikenellaceae bacterium]